MPLNELTMGFSRTKYETEFVYSLVVALDFVFFFFLEDAPTSWNNRLKIPSTMSTQDATTKA
jgi:hypothetical protein